MLQPEARESKQQSACLRHPQRWHLSAHCPHRLQGPSPSLLRQVKTFKVQLTISLLTIFLFSVHVEMKSTNPDGYLSITDYPLLPFYGVMCGVYVLLGKKNIFKKTFFL